ncbi:MAG: hypothetical protein Q9221_001923 [Calogaya cf. arnoldii]
MAVLDPFKAEVLVHGKALRERYPNHSQPPPPRTITKYVEVPTDAEFSVLVESTNPSRPKDLGISLNIDGRLAFSTFWSDKSAHFRGEFSLAEDRTTTLQPLLFKSIDFVNAAKDVISGSLSDEGWQDLGTMKITIHKITEIKKSDYQPRKLAADPITIKNSNLKKPESITQSVILGQARFHSSAEKSRYEWKRIAGEDAAMATFIFKYRTKEVLDLILNPSENIIKNEVEKMSLPEMQAHSSSSSVALKLILQPSMRTWNAIFADLQPFRTVAPVPKAEPVSRDQSLEPATRDRSLSTGLPEPVPKNAKNKSTSDTSPTESTSTQVSHTTSTPKNSHGIPHRPARPNTRSQTPSQSHPNTTLATTHPPNQYPSVLATRHPQNQCPSVDGAVFPRAKSQRPRKKKKKRRKSKKIRTANLKRL